MPALQHYQGLTGVHTPGMHVEICRLRCTGIGIEAKCCQGNVKTRGKESCTSRTKLIVWVYGVLAHVLVQL